MNPSVKIFAGTGSQALAEKIAQRFGAPIGKINIQKLMHIIETLCEYLIVHDEDGGNIKFKVNEYLHNRSKVLDLTT